MAQALNSALTISAETRSNIRVAEYLTTLPPKTLLEAKLHEAMEKARAQLDQRQEP